MANTYTWSIQSMKSLTSVDTYSDVVIEVSWLCTGTDGTYTGGTSGTTPISLVDSDFTPYADLTQEQVLDWIWAMGVVKTAEEAVVDSIINDQKNPAIILPLPWNS